MYEIEELERKWKKYKIKNFLKRFFFISFLMIIVGIYILEKENIFKNSKISYKSVKKDDIVNNDINKRVDKKIVKDLNKTKEENITKKNNKIKITKEKNITNKKELKKIVLKPDTSFELNIDRFKTYEKKETKKSEIKKEKNKINKKNDKKNKVVITKKDNKDFIKQLIESFEKHKDINSAIFLSKIFYKEKKYKKALHWAIIANELDSSNIDSWILFAKANVKLGHKNRAIKALKTFLSNRDSKVIRKLLLEIENGEFK